jgi:hypothetical protein
MAGDHCVGRGRHRLELGKLLCIRGRMELKQGAVDAVRRAPDEAESLTAATGAGPDSALRRAIEQLRAALPNRQCRCPQRSSCRCDAAPARAGTTVADLEANRALHGAPATKGGC